MSGANGNLEHETQPLQQAESGDDADTRNTDQNPNLTGTSLIRHTDDQQETDLVSPYHVDPKLVTDAYENPYRETTDNTQTFIRRVPSSDLVPKPYTKFNHVLVLSIVATVFFCFVGIFAVRFAKSAKMHHSKGLYGLAQRDSKRAVIVSYLGLALGTLLVVVIVVISQTM